MTRRLLHQRESSSALWNSSQGPVSDVWGEELEKSNSSRALSHAESCLLSKAALCWITGRRPLWFPHREESSGGDNWRFLNWQSLSDLHQHSPAPSESSAPPKMLLGAALLWSHPAQPRARCSRGSELQVPMPPGVKPSQTPNRHLWARVSISQGHFPSGVELCCQGSWCVQPQGCGSCSMLTVGNAAAAFSQSGAVNWAPPDCECTNRAHSTPVFMVY